MAPDPSFPSPTVSPPTSPAPEFIPNPAATKTAPAPPIHPKTVGSSSPVPSQAEQLVLGGRSKQERWCSVSPSSSASPSGSPPSFRDVVVSSSRASCAASSAAGGGAAAVMVAGAPLSTTSTAAMVPATSWVPRITLLRRDHPGQWGVVFSTGATCPNSQGWQKALSRGARRRIRHVARPPCRSIPADLVGRCFNCFSTSHTASHCRQRTRCFRCQSQGHRSYVCPAVIHGGNASARPASTCISVWRRISPANEATGAVPPQRPSPAGAAGGAGILQNASSPPTPTRVPVWRWISSAHEATSTATPQWSSPAGAIGGAGSTQGPLEVQAQDQGTRAGQQRCRQRLRFWRRPMQEFDRDQADDPLPGMASS